MHGGTGTRGYTIIEVLIFMAISGMMFVMAASFVSGRQAKAEFRQGMNAVNTQIRDAINDVGNGYFPSNSDFRCVAGSSGAPTFPSGVSNQQGTNQGCVFMGKVVQFGVQGTEQRGVSTYTMAGRQYKESQQDAIFPANFSEARPAPVVANTVDMTQRSRLQWGLKFIRARTVAGDAAPGRSLSGIGFFSSFGSYDSAGNLGSGSQSTILVPIVGQSDWSEADMLAAMPSNIVDSNVDNTPHIVLCFEGGANQYGTLTIGGSNGQRLGTIIKIGNSVNICPS